MVDFICNFSQEARLAGLIKGAHIKLTKIKTEEDHLSEIPVGSEKEGHLSCDLSLGKPLYLDEYGEHWVTSSLEKIFKKENILYIKAGSREYQVTFL